MLDRREFLTKSAAAGAALAGGGLLKAPFALAEAKPSGWVVGDKAVKISGLEQYERKSTLGHLHNRWVLLDVCATWCGPCNQAASQYADLLSEANAHGIPLSLLTVLAEGQSMGSPSQRAAAESWAHRYGFERDSVLHCGGSSSSPLVKLLEEISTANGLEAAYPCYVLIDPKGMVRYFQQERNTEKIKTELAAATGISLPGNYESFPSTELKPNIQSATYSFTIQGKGPVSGTVALGQEGPDCTLTVKPDSLNQTRAFLTLPEGLVVDPEAPVSVVVHPQPAFSYVEGSVIEGSLPLVLFAGAPNEEFTNLIAGGGADKLINELGGVGSGIGPVVPASFEHGPAWGTPATVIEVELAFSLPPAPFGASLGISKKLEEESGSKTARKLLSKGRKDLAHRDFSTAATVFTEAANILGYGSDIARYVTWLANG